MPRRPLARPVRSRISDFFFVHVGSFVAVIVYFVILGQAAEATAGVHAALPSALAVMTGYVLVARSRGLLKHFDFGLWPMFAAGTLGVYVGVDAVLFLFAQYSATILFTTLGLVAAVPLLLGFEPFTMFFARRSTPAWQQKTPEFGAINRLIAAYFALLFFTAAALTAWAPHDLRFAVVYPNLLIFGAGIPSQFWLPRLYLTLFPPGPPETVETAILGMPMVFDRKAAADVDATIQFHVGGNEGGDYCLRIAGGTCESFEGTAPNPDLTIETPASVWLGIARGEIDGTQAFQEGRCSAQGDLSILLRLGEWFPPRGSR